jgi:predicted ATPase
LRLQLPSPDVPQAEAAFLRTLDVARRQQARVLELRAVRSLSRLWRQQGQREAARDLLALLYAWFTEGLDTPDLQEARTLLAAIESAGA